MEQISHTRRELDEEMSFAALSVFSKVQCWQFHCELASSAMCVWLLSDWLVSTKGRTRAILFFDGVIKADISRQTRC